MASSGNKREKKKDEKTVEVRVLLAVKHFTASTAVFIVHITIMCAVATVANHIYK